MKRSNWGYLRIIILVISIVILAVTIFAPNNIAKTIVLAGLILTACIVIDFQAPKITHLSSDNPKIKTLRLLNRISCLIIILTVIFVELKLLDNNLSNSKKEILSVAALSLFMMIFGNFAPKIPFNRYLGLRLPWTIRDEDTWKLAHRILGYISFPLAIILFVLALYAKVETVVLVCILLWVAIPGLYSGWFFYKKVRKC